MERTAQLDIQTNRKKTVEATHRLDTALRHTAGELDALTRDTTARLGAEEGVIFAAHRELLNDTDLLAEAARLLLDGHGAAWSWHQAAERQAARLAALPDPLLASRATDLRDVARRALKHLGENVAADTRFDTPAILIAEDLTPSDTAMLDLAVTLGFCTVSGGPTSHTAILARMLGVPAAVACGAALMNISDGGSAAGARRHGAAASMSACRRATSSERVKRKPNSVSSSRRAAANRALPAATLDGHVLEIGANITRPDQVRDAIANGADGVGLMRTEFLFLERHDAPSEDEQYDCYRRMVEASGGRHLDHSHARHRRRQAGAVSESAARIESVSRRARAASVPAPS